MWLCEVICVDYIGSNTEMGSGHLICNVWCIVNMCEMWLVPKFYIRYMWLCLDAASSVWILEGEACHIEKVAGTRNRCNLQIFSVHIISIWHLTCVRKFLQHIFPRSDTGFLYLTQCIYLPHISIHIQVPVTLGNEMYHLLLLNNQRIICSTLYFEL